MLALCNCPEIAAIRGSDGNQPRLLQVWCCTILSVPHYGNTSMGWGTFHHLVAHTPQMDTSGKDTVGPWNCVSWHNRIVMMLSLEGSQIVTMLTPMPTVRFTMPISQHHSKAKSQVTCDYQGLLTAYAHLKKRQANKLASLQPHWSAAENSKEYIVLFHTWILYHCAYLNTVPLCIS